MVNFKWSDVDILNDDPKDQLRKALVEAGAAPADLEFTIDDIKDICQFDDDDVTFIEGYCATCGSKFKWQGKFRDMPDDLCDHCSGRRDDA